MTNDYLSLSEISGDDVAQEQVERLARRYYWAAGYCHGRDILEVACGAAQGVGLLASVARSVVAGDYSQALLEIARRHYGGRFEFRQFDAQAMPFANDSFDIVLMFEAIYYIPDAELFFVECARVLRPGGKILIATANKDLFDFNPSPHSHRYFGVVEMGAALARHGFKSEFFGDTPVGEVSARQRVLRPLKAAAARLGLIPKSMNAKKLLKRIVFGGLVKMPAEIDSHTAPAVTPTPLAFGTADTSHKVIFCAATKS